MSLQCDSIAANEVNGDLTVKNVTVETEKESPKLYSEISSNKRVMGLHAKTEREFTEGSDVNFTTHLQVSYDLSVATVTTINEEPLKQSERNGPTVVILPSGSLSSPDIKRKKSIVGLNRTITVVMLPQCHDYIIMGKLPRTHSCPSNPMSLMVNSRDDTEIILRPSSDFLPKTLKINKREPASSESEVSDVINIEFERR